MSDSDTLFTICSPLCRPIPRRVRPQPHLLRLIPRYNSPGTLRGTGFQPVRFSNIAPARRFQWKKGGRNPTPSGGPLTANKPIRIILSGDRQPFVYSEVDELSGERSRRRRLALVALLQEFASRHTPNRGCQQSDSGTECPPNKIHRRTLLQSHTGMMPRPTPPSKLRP